MATDHFILLFFQGLEHRNQSKEECGRKCAKGQ